MGQSRELNERQRLFIDAYLSHWNASRAYKEAGYKSKTVNAITTNASILLRKPAVQQEIRNRQRTIRRQYRLQTKEVLEKIIRVINGNIRDFMIWGPDGVTLKPDWIHDDSVTWLVDEVQELKGGGVKLKLHDKMKALELYAKITGMIKDGGPLQDPAAGKGDPSQLELGKHLEEMLEDERKRGAKDNPSQVYG